MTDSATDLPVEGRVRGALLGLLLGDALGRPNQTAAEPATLAASAGGQLVCFTVEGIIRASVRGDHKGICHPPTVIWHALCRWAYAHGVERKAVQSAMQWFLEEWPDGWLAQVPVLNEPRGTAPALMSAIKHPGEEEPGGVNPQSVGGQGLTRGAICGILGPLWDAQAVGALARDVARLTHAPEAARVAGIAATAVRECVTTGDWSQGYSIIRDVGPSSLVARLDAAFSEGQRGSIATDGLQRHATDRTTPSCFVGGMYLFATACQHPDESLEDLLRAARKAPDGAATGAVAGALYGASFGADALPVDGISRLELAWLGDTLARDLYRQFTLQPSGNEFAEGADPHWFSRYPGW